MGAPWGIAVSILALAVGSAVLGCAVTRPTTSPADASASAQPPTPVPTIGPASGRRAIHLDGIDLTTVTLRYTDAQIFFDEEADRAAKADGHPGGAPNPVWIRDLPTTGALPIDPEALVTLTGWDADGNRVPRSATVDILVRVFTAAVPVPGWDSSPYLFVVVEDGRITGIEQPMLP
jgi:hypothetical protein